MMGYDDDFGEEDDLQDLEERADKLAEAAHTFQMSATRLKGKKRFNFQSRSSYIRRQSSSESSSSVSSLEVQVAKVSARNKMVAFYALEFRWSQVKCLIQHMPFLVLLLYQQIILNIR